MRQAVFVLSVVLFVAVTTAAFNYERSDVVAAANDQTNMPAGQTPLPRNSC